MLTKSKSVSINGTSQVDGQIIGYFSANISEDGNVSSSATIADRKLYEVNKAAYKADRDEFNDYADGLIDG